MSVGASQKYRMKGKDSERFLPPQNIEIVDAREEHISQIYLINAESFSDYWSESALLAELSNPISKFRAAILAGQPEIVVGYTISWFVDDVSNLIILAVAPEFRRQRIGSLLLSDCIEISRALHCRNITLEVRVSNRAAIELYRSFDFKVVGIRKKFYTSPREDALILCLPLAD